MVVLSLPFLLFLSSRFVATGAKLSFCSLYARGNAAITNANAIILVPPTYPSLLPPLLHLPRAIPVSPVILYLIEIPREK